MKTFRSSFVSLCVWSVCLVPAGCGGSAPPPASNPAPAASAAPAASGVPVAAIDAGAPVAPGEAKTATELWEGTLHVGPGMQLRLLLHVTRAPDGTLKATCDSLDQAALGMPVDAITRDKTTLAFTMKAIGADYSGKLNDPQTVSTGTFTQRGMALALTMNKTEKVAELARPQTPKPPLPYRSEDVSYANAAGKVTLAGTLTVPQGSGPFPAVVLITGSGAQDRDETLFEHKPFLVIADDLTRKGVAVLRVDDRGVGGSTGDVVNATSEDLAGDVIAGLAFLKQRKEIDPQRLGLVGHSEGGLIAPLVASRSKDVSFAVLLAGPGLTGTELLLLQNEVVARAAGLPQDQVRDANVVNKRIYVALASKRDDKAVAAEIDAILKEVPGGPASVEGGEEALLKRVLNPWFRYLVRYDPKPALAKMKCPALALNGEKDLQVPPEENLAAIRKANPHVVTKELPGLNHLFQPAKTGLPNEYATIETTFDPSALAEISTFVLAQTAKK
ncbi:MAG TPA: alpha/beta fold hydrolase [Polyangiaceae bacterium]